MSAACTPLRSVSSPPTSCIGLAPPSAPTYLGGFSEIVIVTYSSAHFGLFMALIITTLCSKAIFIFNATQPTGITTPSLHGTIPTSLSDLHSTQIGQLATTQLGALTT